MSASRLYLLAALVGGLSTPLLAAEATAPSELQRFRSYPYVERAYRALDRQQPAEAERLMRHVLERLSPGNVEARRILVQALQRQGRYAEALAACDGLPAEQAAPLRGELRLAWIGSDAGVPAERLAAWLADAGDAEAERLWQAQALAVERRQGAGAALHWLQQLPPELHSAAWGRWQATFAERQRDWPAVVAALGGQPALDAEQWQRLGQAYIELQQDDALQRHLQRAPSAEAASALRLAAARRWIGLGRADAARAQLLALREEGRLPAELQRSLYELAREGNDAALADRLAGELGEHCLERSAWLLDRDPAAARRVLAACPPDAQPQRWLAQVQRLRALDLLPRAELPAELHDPLYVELAVAAGQGRQALDWLLRQPPAPARVARSAALAQRLGQTRQAAELWQRHYRASGAHEALEQASYLWLQLGERQRARELLDRAAQRGQPLDRALAARLASLADASAPLSAAELERLLPRLAPAARGELLAGLAAQGRCAEVLRLAAERPASGAEWRALGQCQLSAQPGVAAHALQQGKTLGDRPSAELLPFALVAAGEPARALELWQQQPGAEQDPRLRRAMINAALQAGRLDDAERRWQALPAQNAEDWRQGALIAGARQQYAEACQRWRRVLDAAPGVEDYYQAGMAAGSAGRRAEQLDWLGRAAAQAADDPRIQSDYGYALANGDRAQRRAAVGVLEHAVALRPDDYRLSDALATLQGEFGLVDGAIANWRHTIDLQNQVEPRDARLEEDLFRARRAEQSHTQYTRWHYTGIYAPRGVTSTAERRPSGLYSQQLDVDHRLSDSIGLQGGRLSAIGRVFSSGENSNLTQTFGGAAGLRYTPWRDLNLHASAEVFNEDFAAGDTDLLLRLSASFLDQGDYRNDWRPNQSSWPQRSLYLDAAWWVDESQRFLIARYSRGHMWKLDAPGAQALGPYAMLQASEQDRHQDLRTALGVNWQLWFAEDTYNAYRNSLSLKLEYQRSLGGNLYQQRGGWMGSLELAF